MVSTIKNPHVPGSVLAESTGNKTLAQHFSALYSTFNALSEAEKQLTAIVMSGNVYKYSSKNSSTFVTIVADSTKVIIGYIQLKSSPSINLCTIKASGTTFADSTSDTYDGTVQLVYGI